MRLALDEGAEIRFECDDEMVAENLVRVVIKQGEKETTYEKHLAAVRAFCRASVSQIEAAVLSKDAADE